MHNQRKVYTDSRLSNLEYNFSNEEDKLDDRSGDAQEDEINAHYAHSRLAGHSEVEDEIENEYGASEELQSFSSIDDEMVGLSRLMYVEFSEKIDIEDPHFKIEMKFRSLK